MEEFTGCDASPLLAEVGAEKIIWFYVKGSNLADTTRIWGNSDFTDPTAQILAADLVAPGQFQINFVVPQIADGEYTITVSKSGQTSAADVFFDIRQ